MLRSSQSKPVAFLPIEIKTRLRIATLPLKHSHNVNHAKSHLERSQLLLKSIPSYFELKCRAFSLLMKLWACNFYSQLANALMIEGDYRSSISALEQGFSCITEIYYPELQMFFATSILQVYLMQWDDVNLVKRAVKNCDEVWEMIPPEKRQQCIGLFFHSELLHTFYLLRICDYKNAKQHDYKLVAAVKSDLEKRKGIQDLTT
ncbi:hypothetical protein GIB67_009673 [Kingdonia uniflora]|uniref:Uncharacterized protein n=1 Tax=Kingdonia uniflora TaxID=39325 RepID=A0A7J7LAY0_9MAGN|nr:hypothetical protein GIB67_009673 [Kingdonia uniflora]